ncbi:MAG: hypothetical protein ACKVP5_23135 [Aestuariivirga sp.]
MTRRTRRNHSGAFKAKAAIPRMIESAFVLICCINVPPSCGRQTNPVFYR